MHSQREIKPSTDAEAAPIPASAGSPSSEQALGLENLPNGYYRSKNFIGSLIAVCLMADSLYLGYVLPVNSLANINADLGPSTNYTLISTVATLLAGV